MLYGPPPLGNPDVPRAISVASASSLSGLLGVTGFWAIAVPLLITTSHSSRMQVWLGVIGAVLGVLLAAGTIAAERQSRQLERRRSSSRKEFFFSPVRVGFYRRLWLTLLATGAIAVAVLLWRSSGAGYRTLFGGAGGGSLLYFAAMALWWSSHLRRSEPAILVDEQGIAWATPRARVHHVDWADGPKGVNSGWLFFGIDNAGGRFRHPLRRRHYRIPLHWIDVYPDDLLEAIQRYSPQPLEVRTHG